MATAARPAAPIPARYRGPAQRLARTASDVVTRLPGYNGTLPTPHYSGYLPVGKYSGAPGKLHYWFVESEGSVHRDPVVLWLNGGPGASGIIGFLTELGQLQTIPPPGACTEPSGTSSAPELFYNPYGWTRYASLLTIEQPKGVGFSYCESKPCVNTDESTALDTYEALVAFFAAYPELKSRAFYVTGESYAGVYIPMLMAQIDEHGGLPNFAGAMIGNGCWGSSCFYGVTEAQIDFETFVGHSLVDPALAEEVREACGGQWESVTSDEGVCGGHRGARTACHKLLHQMCAQTSVDGFNVYNIYDTCFPSDNERGSDKWAGLAAVRARLRRPEVTLASAQDSWRSHPALGSAATDGRRQLFGATPPPPAGLGSLNDYACGSETRMEAWLDSADVQAALHVRSDLSGMRYQTTCGDLRPLYAELVAKHRVLIYSGSVDACVPTWGSERWTRDLGLDVERAWHPWKSASASVGASAHAIAGYAIRYEHNFTFATVKGAGHEVPRFKPAFALTLFRKFINGEPL